MSFENRNILVVGGSAGIGAAVLEMLAERGANLWTVSRNKPEDIPEGAQWMEYDVTADDSSGLAEFLPEKLHGIVYCPGTINLKPFGRLTIDDFRSDFDVNLLGAVRVLQAAIGSLRKSKDGSVVLFSTVAVGTGMSYHASIATAKAAVEGLARSLAAEYARQNIRFNVVAPSMTETRLAGDLLSSEERRNHATDRHPLKRIGVPADIAAAAVYLLSPEASWMTGQVFGVDGGMGRLKPL